MRTRWWLALPVLAIACGGGDDDDGDDDDDDVGMIDAQPVDATAGADGAMAADAAVVDAATSDGAVADAAAPDAAAVADAAGPDAPPPDAAAGPDAPPPDAAGPDAPPPDALVCPSPMTATGPGPIIIESVDFTTNTVVVRNTAIAAVNTTGWQWCVRPAYGSIGTTSIAAGAAHSVTVSPDLLATGGEVALYNVASFGSITAIESYVVWEAVPASSRITVAIGAGLWPAADQVATVDAGHTGLIATGDTTTPTGWTSAPAACF